MEQNDWNSTEKLFDDLIALQYKKLLQCGQQIIPNITADDLLQPNDFLELEYNPLFRYEEGVLSGIQTAQMALRSLQLDKFNT